MVLVILFGFHLWRVKVFGCAVQRSGSWHGAGCTAGQPACNERHPTECRPGTSQASAPSPAAPSLPCPHPCRFHLFALFPVVLGLGLTWLYAAIFTWAGVYDNSSPQTQARFTLHCGGTGAGGGRRWVEAGGSEAWLSIHAPRFAPAPPSPAPCLRPSPLQARRRRRAPPARATSTTSLHRPPGCVSCSCRSLLHLQPAFLGRLRPAELSST